MRQNFGPKPFLYPMPVLILATYGADGTPNAMNAAWGCIADMNRVAVYVAGEHKTMENIKTRKAFTVSMATAASVVEADFVGVVSGNDVPDKLVKTGWHLEPSQFVDAPIIRELPLALECRLVSFDEESELLLGEIVNVCAEESILTDGKIDPEKLQPITYDPVNHTYRTLGAVAGRAFFDGKKLK